MSRILFLLLVFFICTKDLQIASGRTLKNDLERDLVDGDHKMVKMSLFSSSVLHQQEPSAKDHNYLLPHNISIVLIQFHPHVSIRVTWSYGDNGSTCEAFRIIYHPDKSRYRYIIEVPCTMKNVTIERLLPSTEYVLTINPVPLVIDPDVRKVEVGGRHKVDTSSSKKEKILFPSPNTIRFITPQTEFNRFSKYRSSSLIIRKSPIEEEGETVIVKTGELLVVLFVLSGWLLIIIIFIKKWGKIRGIETVATLDPRAVTETGTGGVLPFAFLPNQLSSSNHSSAVVSLKQQKSKDSGDSTTMDTTTRRQLDDAMLLFLGEGQCQSDSGIICSCKRCRGFKTTLDPPRRTSWALLESIPEKEPTPIDIRKYKSAENLFQVPHL